MLEFLCLAPYITAPVTNRLCTAQERFLLVFGFVCVYSFNMVVILPAKARQNLRFTLPHILFSKSKENVNICMSFLSFIKHHLENCWKNCNRYSAYHLPSTMCRRGQTVPKASQGNRDSRATAPPAQSCGSWASKWHRCPVPLQHNILSANLL